jgi:hypothetical protein
MPSSAPSNTTITGFTTSLNTASPNDTVNIARLLTNTVSTHGDLVLSPKGTGALIMGAIPTGGATTGNKRGSYAIDLAISRVNATEVASGSFSFNSGKDGTASNSYSVNMGYQGVASGSMSRNFGATGQAANYDDCNLGWGGIASGSSSLNLMRLGTASGQYSINAGFNGIASGTRSSNFADNGLAQGTQSICIATEGQSLANQSVTLGKRVLSNVIGKLAFGCDYLSALGDNQLGVIVFAQRTTDATPIPLLADKTVPIPAISSSNILLLNNNSIFIINGTVSARKTDNTIMAWDYTAVVSRGASANTIAIDSKVINVLHGNTNISFDIKVDTAIGGVYIEVTGEASNTWQWVATMFSNENTY